MLSFLEACNKIFEQGLLSHDKVTACDSQVLTNIKEGYQFFTYYNGEYINFFATACGRYKSQGACHDREFHTTILKSVKQGQKEA